MSTGLAASTVTPGSTAPEVSLTVPVIDACAKASEGSRAVQTRTTAHRSATRMCSRLLSVGSRQRPNMVTDLGERTTWECHDRFPTRFLIGQMCRGIYASEVVKSIGHRSQPPTPEHWELEVGRFEDQQSKLTLNPARRGMRILTPLR